MAEVVRTIDTDRGPLLVTVQRIADRGTMRELTADDLLKAARVLFREAALMSRNHIVSVPMRGGRYAGGDSDGRACGTDCEHGVP